MALLTIHTPEGLGEADVLRAAEVGPSLVGSEASIPELLGLAGFADVVALDRTEAFARCCEIILRVRAERERELREEEGDEAFEEERAKKEALLGGIRGGLLLRSLFVARRREASLRA